jgi:ribosomal protein S18 acetylase RimI-like enzyme
MTQERPYRLRRLETSDLETVASFECEIAKISFPDDPITDLNFYVRKLRHVVDDDNAAGIVAVDQSGPVGWAYVSKRQNFITKQQYADFHSIYVSPSQRGSGIVSDLVEAVLAFCRQERLDRVVFRTRASNERMKAVLVRSGFQPTQIYYERTLGPTDHSAQETVAD